MVAGAGIGRQHGVCGIKTLNIPRESSLHQWYPIQPKPTRVVSTFRRVDWRERRMIVPTELVGVVGGLSFEMCEPLRIHVFEYSDPPTSPLGASTLTGPSV